MLKALITGEISLFAMKLQEVVKSVLSYHDTAGDADQVYHAFVLGLLVHLTGCY